MFNKLVKMTAGAVLAASLAAPAFAYGGTVLLSLDIVTDMETVYNPNDRVQYELTVNNENAEAWLRCRFGFDSYNVDVEFNDDYINAQDGWVLRGGYWYYTRKAESRTSYLIADCFTVPDITEAGDGAWIYVSAVVDAIDYDSCVPDFDSEEPWGDTELAYSVTTAGAPGSASGSSSFNGGKAYNQTTLFGYSSPTGGASRSYGEWEYTPILNIWKYGDAFGNYAADGWYYLYNPYTQDGTEYSWFHFDGNGVMSTGWVKDNETDWRYAHEVSDGNLGMLITGWYEEPQDGATYYLDPETGLMHTGLDAVDGETYYFATLDDIPAQTWFWDTAIGGWLYKLLGYRSYGSMYRDEANPAGYMSGQDGTIDADFNTEAA